MLKSSFFLSFFLCFISPPPQLNLSVYAYICILCNKSKKSKSLIYSARWHMITNSKTVPLSFTFCLDICVLKPGSATTTYQKLVLCFCDVIQSEILNIINILLKPHIHNAADSIATKAKDINRLQCPEEKKKQPHIWQLTTLFIDIVSLVC